MIAINITDKVTPMLRGAAGQLKGTALENAMGQGASELIQRHLVALNAARPNALGGKRTNFYSRAAKATNYQVKPGEVTVVIAHQGIRQRYQGGFIRPTGGRKYLTIPAIPEAYGKRASELNNLRFGFTEGRSGNLVPALVEASATKVKFGRARQDGSRRTTITGNVGGRAFFYLVRQVFQQADPSVLPTNDQIAGAAVKAGDVAIQTAANKGAKS